MEHESEAGINFKVEQLYGKFAVTEYACGLPFLREFFDTREEAEKNQKEKTEKFKNGK